MSKCDLLVACASKYRPDLKEEGDIISVRPHPTNWGKTSRLIVTIETDEDWQTLRVLYETSIEDIKTGKILKENRFQIPYDIIKNGWFPLLDLSKVKDRYNIQQPLKEANVIIDTKEQVSLIWDKYKKSFKYPTLKVAEIG